MDSVLEKRSLVVVFLFLVSNLAQFSFGAVHKVGESAGWTTIANVDYKQWAISKSFQVGDIIGINTLSLSLCACKFLLL